MSSRPRYESKDDKDRELAVITRVGAVTKLDRVCGARGARIVGWFA